MDFKAVTNGFVGLLLKTVVFCLIVLGLYYLFILKPQLETSSSLLNAENVLTKQRFILAENKFLYMELSKLEITPLLHTEIDEITKKLKEANKEGLTLSENKPKLRPVRGVSSETLGFINIDLPQKYNNIVDKSMNLYIEQSKIIDNIINLDSKLEKIYEYSSYEDLGKLDPIKDKDMLLTRIAKAKEGLNNIKKNVSSEDKSLSLASEIDKTVLILEELEIDTNAGGKSFVKINTNLSRQFLKTKNTALSTMLSVITSPNSVKLLTEQTNLILEYDFLLQKINEHRMKL